MISHIVLLLALLRTSKSISVDSPVNKHELQMSEYFQSYKVIDSLNLSSGSIVAFPYSSTYHRYLVPANGACVSSGCPDVIILPATVQDISKIVNMVHTERLRERFISLSVKGGGHSYTCQANNASHHGILLDTRLLNGLTLNYDVSSSVPVSITVGSGLRFSDILKFLRQNASTSKLVVVHGQCLDVGVAGFTLHGGIHFGALSELHGLAAYHVEGIEAVLANGTIINTRRGVDPRQESEESDIYSSLRDDLMFAMSGAGSSFAIAASLTLRLHDTSQIKAALALVEIDLGQSAQDALIAANEFYQFAQALPSPVSLTFFGLDKYFKAALFQLPFTTDRGKWFVDSLAYIQAHINAKKSGGKRIFFVLEASWVESPESEIGINVLEQRTVAALQASQVLHAQSWLPLNSYSWAVPSYDLVWGSGHSYSGASITVPDARALTTLADFFSGYQTYLHGKERVCSDCVAVIHIVGKGLRAAAKMHDKAVSTHGALVSAALWLELDCGVFAREKAALETKCGKFVDFVQSILDAASTSADGSVSRDSFHYPNVPNLSSRDWMNFYYGSNLARLQAIKGSLDPLNIFSHCQSISSSSTSVSEEISRQDSDIDSALAPIPLVRTRFMKPLAFPWRHIFSPASSSPSCRMAYQWVAFKDTRRVLSGVLGAGIMYRVLSAVRTALTRRSRSRRIENAV